MTERAERRLTLMVDQELVIHALCIKADAAVWALTYGTADERKKIAGELSAAWKAVSHGMMP